MMKYVVGVYVRISYVAIPPRHIDVGVRLPVTRFHNRSSYNYMLTEATVTCAAATVVLKRFTVVQER